MADEVIEINPALREHTTSIGFNLTLSKRMISLLVALYYFKGYHGFSLFERRYAYFPHFVSTARALSERGLVEKGETKLASNGLPNGWQLTRAGHLVIALLKEAGIYQERIKEWGLE